MITLTITAKNLDELIDRIENDVIPNTINSTYFGEGWMIDGTPEMDDDPISFYYPLFMEQMVENIIINIIEEWDMPLTPTPFIHEGQVVFPSETAQVTFLDTVRSMQKVLIDCDREGFENLILLELCAVKKYPLYFAIGDDSYMQTAREVIDLFKAEDIERDELDVRDFWKCSTLPMLRRGNVIVAKTSQDLKQFINRLSYLAWKSEQYAFGIRCRSLLKVLSNVVDPDCDNDEPGGA